MNADEKERCNQKNVKRAKLDFEEIFSKDGEKGKRLSHLIQRRIKNADHVNQDIETKMQLLDQMLDTEAQIIRSDQRAQNESNQLQGLISEKINDYESQKKNLNAVEIEEKKDSNETLMHLQIKRRDHERVLRTA